MRSVGHGGLRLGEVMGGAACQVRRRIRRPEPLLTAHGHAQCRAHMPVRGGTCAEARAAGRGAVRLKDACHEISIFEFHFDKTSQRWLFSVDSHVAASHVAGHSG